MLRARSLLKYKRKVERRTLTVQTPGEKEVFSKSTSHRLYSEKNTWVKRYKRLNIS